MSLAIVQDLPPSCKAVSECEEYPHEDAMSPAMVQDLPASCKAVKSWPEALGLG